MYKQLCRSVVDEEERWILASMTRRLVREFRQRFQSRPLQHIDNHLHNTLSLIASIASLRSNTRAVSRFDILHTSHSHRRTAHPLSDSTACFVTQL
jgi:hypothetical protein